MIVSVQYIKQLIKRANPNDLLNISPGGITLLRCPQQRKQRINLAAIYALLASGMAPSDVARETGASKQLINSYRKKLDDFWAQYKRGGNDETAG